MDVSGYLIIFRGIERLLVLLAGIVCVILGAWLFKWGVYDKTSIVAEKAGIKFKILGASPGVIFAILGSIIFMLSLYQKASFEKTEIDNRKVKTAASESEIEDFTIEKSEKWAYSKTPDEIKDFLKECQAITPDQNDAENTKKLKALNKKIIDFLNAFEKKDKTEKK